ALRSDGSLYAFGENAVGQLGLSSLDPATQPAKLVGGGFTSIAAGREISLARIGAGQVAAWGKWSDGSVHMSPVVLPGLSNAASIALSGTDPLASLPDNTVVRYTVATGWQP